MNGFQIRRFCAVVGVWVLLLGMMGGCRYQECKTNPAYADDPGMCGKIHRIEQSKERFNRISAPKIYLILVVFLLPLVILVLMKIFRFSIRNILYKLTSLIHRRRDGPE